MTRIIEQTITMHVCATCGKPTQFVGLNCGYKWHCNASCAKFDMSASTKQKMCIARRRRIITDDTKQKLSAANKRRYANATVEQRAAHARSVAQGLIRYYESHDMPYMTKHRHNLMSVQCCRHSTQINTRSSFETAFVLALEHACVLYDYERVRIKYMYNELLHTYVVDFYLPTLQLLVEIKPYKLTLDKYVRTQAKFTAAKQWCVEHDMQFVVITEFELFKDNLIDYLKSISTLTK